MELFWQCDVFHFISNISMDSKKTKKLKTKSKTIKHWKNSRLLMCNHWLWYEQISVNNTGDGYVNTFLIEDLFQYFTQKNESEIVYMLLILFITTPWEYKKQLLNRGQSNARKSFFRFTIFFFLRYQFLDMYVIHWQGSQWIIIFFSHQYITTHDIKIVIYINVRFVSSILTFFNLGGSIMVKASQFLMYISW